MRCPCTIDLEIEIIEQDINLEIGPIEQDIEIEIESSGSSLPYYTGPYEVTPKPYDKQILNTTRKSMSEDVVIDEVPYSETTNPSGGTTVNIAYIM